MKQITQIFMKGESPTLRQRENRSMALCIMNNKQQYPKEVVQICSENMILITFLKLQKQLKRDLIMAKIQA